MRKFKPDPQSNNHGWTPPTLRTTKKAAIYARRSDPAAKSKETDASQSREMQTEDLLAWGYKAGWKETFLEPYFADLGLSGTLRPDERPDMLRLFDDIDAGKLDNGSIICYQESRLFRDETQIYYNQFIQKCKEHNILVVAVSPYTMIYDFQDEFLTEMFRWKCREAGEWIKRHVKGWMHPAKERAARSGLWAGMGDISIGYIVDNDPHSANYKRFVVYEPHAELVRYLFRRFLELAGDFGKLCKEMLDNPVIFPPFPQEIADSYIIKSRFMRTSQGIIRNRSVLQSILTNRAYLGWRIVKGAVVNKQNHEPIVDEELFAFAFTTLTGCSLDAEPLDDGRKRNVRFYHGKKVEDYALLKDRITATEGSIHAHLSGRYKEKQAEAYYIYHSPLVERQPGLSGKGYVEFGNVKKFDDMVAARLLDHIREIQSLPAYDEELQRKKEEKARKIQSLTESIAQIPIEQATIAAQLGKTTNESVITVLLAQIERLDIEQKKLIKIKEELETENSVSLRALDEELRDLETHWDTYPMAKRVALINFLIEKVVVDIMSLHWLRIRVHWLHEEWGVEQVYYCRDNYGTYRWKSQEDEILRIHYPDTERLVLMRLLPTRSWEAIRHRAVVLNVKRPLAWEKRGNQKMTYEDIVFMEQEGLTEDVKVTNWTSVSPPGAKVICS